MNVKTLRFLDKYIVGFLILILFRLKYFSVSKRKPKKILVIRLRALGSSLLSFPMIKQLENHYGKDVQYDLLATSRNIWVFKNQWYFTQIYNIFSLKWFLNTLFSFKKYDIVIDVEEYFRISAFMALWLGKKTIGFGNMWSRKVAYTNPIIYNDQQHTILTFLDLLKPLDIKIYIPQTMEPLIYYPKDEKKVVSFLDQYPHKKFVCMHTWWAETAKERAWPTYKRIELIKILLKDYKEIVILLSWTYFEKKIAQDIAGWLTVIEQKSVINICWIFNLYEFAFLLKQCNLMISNDTGPMHLAAAMWTKTIGLFGPEMPSKFGPWPLNKNIWLYKWDGKACIKVHLAVWQKDTHYSVNKITSDDVLYEINKLKL